MIGAGAFGIALLLAAQAAAPSPSEAAPAHAVPARFAPPTERPLVYRVTTRRLSRDGTLIGFTLVYDLQWRHAGRGFQLDARLDRIESDARPQLVEALTLMLQPLVGETLTYLVAADGSSIEAVDPDAPWLRALDRFAAAGASADRPEARSAAALIAAVPPAQRARVATADIRALVAGVTRAAPSPGEPGVAATDDGASRTITQVEQADGAAAHGLRIERSWTFDAATGLLQGERRQSWSLAPDASGAATLIEEFTRSLTLADG